MAQARAIPKPSLVSGRIMASGVMRSRTRIGEESCTSRRGIDGPARHVCRHRWKAHPPLPIEKLALGAVALGAKLAMRVAPESPDPDSFVLANPEAIASPFRMPPHMLVTGQRASMLSDMARAGLAGPRRGCPAAHTGAWQNPP